MSKAKAHKILFITLCPVDMNTSAMMRNWALIKGLVTNNATIDLLTIPALFCNKYFTNSVDSEESVNIIKLTENKAYTSLIKSDASLKGKLKKRLLPFARYIYHSFCLYDNTIFIAKGLGKNTLPMDYYDIIISSSDPKSSHIAAIKLIASGLRYGKWIQYWGDPFAIDITKKSLYPNWYVKRVEKNILTKGDIIVYVSPFTLREQEKIFPNSGCKMKFIPSPYFQTKIQEKSIGKRKNLTLGYFGDYQTTVRDIGPIYRYAKKSGERFIIAGNSDIELEKNKNIMIYPRITIEKVSQLEADSDVLVSILNKKGTQIPGKIYHYAATNKPILVLLDGEHRRAISSYLKSFNRYILCDNNEDDIEKALNRIRQEEKQWEPSPYFSPELIGRKFIYL